MHQTLEASVIHLMDLRRMNDKLPGLVKRFGPQTVFVDPYIFTIIALTAAGHYVATSPHDPRLFLMNGWGEMRHLTTDYPDPDMEADLTHLNMTTVVQGLAELELAGKANLIESVSHSVAQQIMALRGGRLWTPGAQPEQAVLDMLVARKPDDWGSLANAMMPTDMLTTEESERFSLTNALVALAWQILTPPAN